MSEPRLNTRTKRGAALVMVAGFAMMALGFMQYAGSYAPFSNAHYWFMRGPLWALRHAGVDSNSTGAFLNWLGFLLVVGGLLASFLYDLTVGKVVHWVQTGSFAPAQLARAPTAYRPRKPLPVIVQWVAEVLLLLLQNWVTALTGFVMGVIYLEERDLQWLLVPAATALVMWLRSAFGAAATDGGLPRGMFLLLGIKLMIGYVFVGLGLLLAVTGAVR